MNGASLVIDELQHVILGPVLPCLTYGEPRIDDLLAEGRRQLAAGQLAVADETFRKVLAADPDHDPSHGDAFMDDVALSFDFNHHAMRRLNETDDE